jgi:hypothetical protein
VTGVSSPDADDATKKKSKKAPKDGVVVHGVGVVNMGIDHK